MKNHQYLKKYFHTLLKNSLSIDIRAFDNLIKLIKKLKKNNKIIIAGNGGSASIANHVSVDFSKILKKRSITFNEANLITCYANDFGHENWMKEALKTHGAKDDILILISSSGRSKNIINCALQAKKMQIRLVTFSGFNSNNKLKKQGLINFWVNSNVYNIVETTHQTWLLSVCDFISKTKIK